MSIPDFQSIMLPLLKLINDEKNHSLQNVTDRLANHFNLTEKERNKLLPSGSSKVFYNRVGWARIYLKKAGLLEDPKRGYMKITKKGKQVLKKNPKKIDIGFLRQFPGFQNFRGGEENDSKVESEKLKEKKEFTPQEMLEYVHQDLLQKLQLDLLDKIKDSSPTFFEKLVVDLLVEMGYGGSRKDAGEAIGKSGDKGIDGIIKEDKLGFNTLYIQAKRWDNATVGRPEIQKFAGALQGKKSKKGVFITTSSFSKEAKEYAQNLSVKIILINGSYLTRLMIENEIGISTTGVYKTKEIDSDYFIEH